MNTQLDCIIILEHTYLPWHFSFTRDSKAAFSVSFLWYNEL